MLSKEHQKKKLQRGLDNRHIQLIALGGSIGVGLFYGSSATIQMGGPSILLSYLVGGLVIFTIMRALGEMAVDEPVSGSFSSYANRYLGTFNWLDLLVYVGCCWYGGNIGSRCLCELLVPGYSKLVGSTCSTDRLYNGQPC